MSTREVTLLALALACWREELMWFGRVNHPTAISRVKMQHLRYFGSSETFDTAIREAGK